MEENKNEAPELELRRLTENQTKSMKTQEPQSESVKSTLGELLKTGIDTDLRPYQVLIGHNMGYHTLLMSIPIDKFYDISEVANERNLGEKPIYEGQLTAQRDLDPKHAERLATYIIKSLFGIAEQKRLEMSDEFYEMRETIGAQPYQALQPITANIRECELGGNGLRVERSKDGAVTVYLAPRHVLWVVDGQHRREAMRYVFEFLKDVTTTLKYPRRALYPGADSGTPVTASELQVWNLILEAWRSGLTVMVEVHLGLDSEQERQLFHDLNNLTKKVAAGLAFNFDNSNPINLFIKEELIESTNALFKDKVVERDNTPWVEDKGVISRKDLITINAVLFLNKSNVRAALPQETADNKAYAQQFWNAVRHIPHVGSNKAKLKTVAAQAVMLKTLAKLAYTYGIGRSSNEAVFKKFIAAIPSVDFSHSNPMWRYNRLTEDERETLCPGLSDYLQKGYIEIGSYDDSTSQPLFRFNPMHNDIMPVIADMLRWAMKLPNRHLETTKKSALDI